MRMMPNKPIPHHHIVRSRLDRHRIIAVGDLEAVDEDVGCADIESVAIIWCGVESAWERVRKDWEEGAYVLKGNPPSVKASMMVSLIVISLPETCMFLSTRPSPNPPTSVSLH